MIEYFSNSRGNEGIGPNSRGEGAFFLYMHIQFEP